MWATTGRDVTNKFGRIGYSCLGPISNEILYGTVICRAVRSIYYKQWLWTVPAGQEGSHWFFLYNNGVLVKKFSIALPDLTLTVPVPKDVKLRIIDYNTDAVISGATIFIDAVNEGVTDINGELMVYGILTGSHAVRVVASGFLDTDVDSLANDTIIIY